MLGLQLARETKIAIHPAHLNRLIRWDGTRYNWPRPTVRPSDPWTANERLAELIAIVEGMGPDEVLVAEDEVDIHLNPKIGPMWMMKGQQAEVLTPGNNTKHYMADSINVATEELVWVDGERKKSALFISWMDQLAANNPDAPTIHVLLDNAKIHDSGVTLKALAKHGGRIKLHPLPPYCPECNPMEHVWLQLHANATRNHPHRTMEDLMAATHAFMRAASPFPGSSPSRACLDVAS